MQLGGQGPDCENFRPDRQLFRNDQSRIERHLYRPIPGSVIYRLRFCQQPGCRCPLSKTSDKLNHRLGRRRHSISLEPNARQILLLQLAMRHGKIGTRGRWKLIDAEQVRQHIQIVGLLQASRSTPFGLPFSDRKTCPLPCPGNGMIEELRSENPTSLFIASFRSRSI